MARAAWREYAAGSEVAHFAGFCREFCEQSEDRWAGKPLELEPWQRQMMGEALAYDKHGWPVWQSAHLIVPRKNGKTALLSALAIYRLLTADDRPEVLQAAASDKQAGRLFDSTARFIRRNPELRRLLRIRDHVGEIVREDGMGIIYRVASDAKTLHGYNPTLVICDELAQWTTPTLKRAFAALTTGGGARQAPQVFGISTAGEASTRHDSILGRILDMAANPDQAGPALRIGRVFEAETLVYEYSAPTGDPFDLKAMKQANPASWITREYLRRQAADAELTDADVLQLHGCVWAAQGTTWIPPVEWIAAARPERQLVDDESIVLGFDGSEKRDSTVLSAGTLDGWVVPLGIWERPPRAPEDWRVPRREVHEAIDAAMERYDVLELAADPPGWYSEFDEWTDRYGEQRVVAFDTNQNKRFAPACERFATGISGGAITHSGHPILSAHVGHCVAVETPFGTKITKDHPDSPRKIDAAVSCVIAADRAAWYAANRVGVFAELW